MKFKAVIFDLDGTLLNTLNDIVGSLNKVLRDFKFNTHSYDDYKYYVGNGAKILIDRVVPKDTSETLKEDILKRYLSTYEEHQYDKTCVYEGIEDLLFKLNKLEISISVLSNKPHNATVSVISHYFRMIEFQCVFGQRPGIPIKPDKTSAIEISKIIGISPSEIIYLGDSDVDMKTAVSSGMFPVGALWGFRTKLELLENGAKKVIDHPLDLLEIIHS